MQEGETQSPNNKGVYFHKYLQYASSIISSYKGNEPFHIFLKKYFSINKKHGSKDRKIISALCYNYFRVGFGVSSNIDSTEKFLLSTFLCERSPSPLLQFFKPKWNATVQLPLNDKFKIAGNEFNVEKIFSFSDELNSQIDSHEFNLSFLLQPKLFIRVRPDFRNIVPNKIQDAKFLFEEMNDDCIAFSNNEKMSRILDIDKEAVIQDYNSQRTLDFIKPLTNNTEGEIRIWDCCAGGGGKSILAFDIFKNVQLTVSDKRKNILENLKLRFDKAAINNYKFITEDLQLPAKEIYSPFDIIIADVPCTGSGTWARTPEQLTFFNKKEIEKYALLQKKIIENVVPHLNTNGHLLYITCSVFEKENEENVSYIRQKFQLDLIKMEYLKGYEMRADTLFVALLQKNP
jgi:16S rRNA (cytosine967-C5)-methyltransferase